MVSLVLKGAAFLYRIAVSVRGTLYDYHILRSYRSRIPVVSIGNVTAGGNGKTPLCLFLAQEFAARGLKPAILSRGYGGSERGPYRVNPADSAAHVGDEPLLMAQSCSVPVYISRSRVRGAKKIEQEGLADIILLDDGFQHRALEREVDIVTIFAGTTGAIDEFLEGRLLPEGLFREPRDRALKRASAVVISERRVITDSDNLPPIDSRLLGVLPPGMPVFRSFFEAVGVRNVETEKPLEARRVHAFAAIANPATFFDSLRELGFTVVSHKAFPDHHAFSEADLRALRFEHPDLPLVCTSKDAVKLSDVHPELRGQCYALQVAVKVVPTDAFMVALQRRLMSSKLP